jgi:K+-sensing histidine kinase KdpD
MNPLTAIQTVVACIIAFALGLLIGGVPAYFIGKAHEAEKKGLQVGALTTSVESCTVAAQAADVSAKAAKTASDELETRLTAVITGENARLEKQLRGSRDKRLAYVPPGATECERTVNAVRDQLMGGKR